MVDADGNLSQASLRVLLGFVGADEGLVSRDDVRQIDVHQLQANEDVGGAAALLLELGACPQ